MDPPSDSPISCGDSAYSSRKNTDDPHQALDCAMKARNNSDNSDNSDNSGMTAVSDTADGQDNGAAIVLKGQHWKVLIATSLQSFLVLGLTQSFGTWQRHYGSEAAVQDGVLQPAEMTKRAFISTIGAFCNGGIVAVFGVFYYPYMPLIGGNVKTICLAGTILIGVGFGVAALSTHLYVLFIGQGILVGLGCGLLLYTLAPILPEYFGDHVGLAQGIQSASAAAGGTCLSLITPKLFEAVGTRATLAIFAGIGVFIGIIVSILAQAPRKFEKRSIHVIGWKDFQKAEFTLLLLVNLVNPLTIAIPMTFGPDFSKALGFEMQMATILLAVNSAVGIPTRLANGYIADYIGHQNILLLSTALYMLGTWALWLTAAQTSNGTIWIAFTVIHGVFNGTFITVINSIQKHLFGAELYYPYNGAMTSMKGIGYVAGIPIAGHLVNRDKKDSDLKGEDFTKAIYCAGVVLAFNVLCQIGVRVVDGRKHGWKWKR